MFVHLIRKLISSHSKLNAKPSLQRDLATFRILHVIDNYPPNMHSILFVSHPRLFITHPHIYKCTCHWSNLLVHIIDKTLCSNSVFWISFFYKKKASFHISLSIWFKNWILYIWNDTITFRRTHRCLFSSEKSCTQLYLSLVHYLATCWLIKESIT